MDAAKHDVTITFPDIDDDVYVFTLAVVVVDGEVYASGVARMLPELSMTACGHATSGDGAQILDAARFAVLGRIDDALGALKVLRQYRPGCVLPGIAIDGQEVIPSDIGGIER